MPCEFAEVENSCGCIIGYNVPLKTVEQADITQYPVTVLNVDGIQIRIANSPTEYAALWNSNITDRSKGKLIRGNSAFCFFIPKVNGVTPPPFVLGVVGEVIQVTYHNFIKYNNTGYNLDEPAVYIIHTSDVSHDGMGFLSLPGETVSLEFPDFPSSPATGLTVGDFSEYNVPAGVIIDSITWKDPASGGNGNYNVKLHYISTGNNTYVFSIPVYVNPFWFNGQVIDQSNTTFPLYVRFEDANSGNIFNHGYASFKNLVVNLIFNAIPAPVGSSGDFNTDYDIVQTLDGINWTAATDLTIDSFLLQGDGTYQLSVHYKSPPNHIFNIKNKAVVISSFSFQYGNTLLDTTGNVPSESSYIGSVDVATLLTGGPLTGGSNVQVADFGNATDKVLFIQVPATELPFTKWSEVGNALQQNQPIDPDYATGSNVFFKSTRAGAAIYVTRSQTTFGGAIILSR